MAAKFTPVKGGEADIGHLRLRVWDMQLDNNYPAGGYFIQPNDIGLGIILSISLGGRYIQIDPPPLEVQLMRYPQWDPSTGKLQLFVSSTAGLPFEEIVAGLNVSSDVVRIAVIGA